MVLIKRVGLLLKLEIILARVEPFSFNNSTRSLLADTKAISTPEKKAIRISETSMANNSTETEFIIIDAKERIN